MILLFIEEDKGLGFYIIPRLTNYYSTTTLHGEIYSNDTFTNFRKL